MSGRVTKMNGPARRVLGPPEEAAESPNLGSLVASFIAANKEHADLATISFVAGDGQEQEMVIVLSNEPAGGTDNGSPAGQAWPAASEPGESPRLAHYIAHELRNPLSTILGISKILENRFQYLSLDDRTMALHSVEGEAERALLILEGLLRLAGARTRPNQQVAEVPLHAVLRKVVDGHRRRNPERALTLTGDSPMFARCDSEWAELAVANLLSNAEKYTPRGSEIEIASHQSGSWSTIMVLDNGTALPPDRYQRLWDIYAHGPDPEISVSGSGIGLSLCKELVEGMGGHVWAGPKGTGGSAFAVSLPAPWDTDLPAPLATALSGSESDESWAAILV